MNELKNYDVPDQKIFLPFIRSNTITQIYSGEGVGKTRFAMSACLAIATGEYFAKWKPENTGKVFYFDAEMPMALIKQIQPQYRLWDTVSPNFHYFNKLEKIRQREIQGKSIPKGYFDLADETFRKQMKKKLLEESYDIVVFDNLFHMANVDFIKAEEWFPIMGYFAELRNEGLAVIFIHHSNNAGSDYGSVIKRVNLDANIQLKKIGTQPGKFTFRDEKDRMNYLGGKSFTMRQVEIDDYLEWVCENDEVMSENKQNDECKEIMEFLVEGYTQAQIAEMMDVKKLTIGRKYREVIEANGYMKKEGRKHVLTEKGEVFLGSV